MRANVTATDWAIITPSYSGDFERCQLLCESMDAFVTGPWHHYIIVDRIDFELFKSMNNSRRTVIEKQTLLPSWLRYLFKVKLFRHQNVWFGRPVGFIGGWQVQQLVKIEMAHRINEAGMLFCDSDMFFVKPFNVKQLVQNKLMRFYRNEFASNDLKSDLARFNKGAAEILGLERSSLSQMNFVNNMVTWHAPTVRAMCEHIANRSGKNWMVAVSRFKIYSEYTLYGLFVDHLAINKKDFFPTDDELCATAWGSDYVSGNQLTKFFENLLPHQVAVGIQSFIGVKIETLRDYFHRSIQQHRKD